MKAIPQASHCFPRNRPNILPSAAGVIHLTVKDSSVGGKALNVANHHLYATKFKDTEVRGSSPYNLLDVEDPLVDFEKFQNSENLEQEDL